MKKKASVRTALTGKTSSARAANGGGGELNKAWPNLDEHLRWLKSQPKSKVPAVKLLDR